MRFLTDQSWQYWFYRGGFAAGLSLYILLNLTILNGSWLLTAVLSFALVIGIMKFLVRTFEPDPTRGWRITSTLLQGPEPVIYGRTILFAPALVVASYAYGHEGAALRVLPSHAWWRALGVVSMVVFGIVFRWIDNRNYTNVGGWSDAQESKLLVDPLLANAGWPSGVVVATVVPIWIHGGIYAALCTWLIGAWVAVAVCEVLFERLKPNPFAQHEMWQEQEFRPMTLEESEAWVDNYFADDGF